VEVPTRQLLLSRVVGNILEPCRHVGTIAKLDPSSGTVPPYVIGARARAPEVRSIPKRVEFIRTMSDNHIWVVEDEVTLTDSGNSGAIVNISVGVSTTAEGIQRSDVGLWSRDRRTQR